MIEREYNQELERVSRSPECRAELVRRLLAGGPVDTDKLGYRFDAWHLCVIVTGVGTEKAVRRLVAALGRECLPFECGGGMCAWLGGQRKLTITDVELPAQEFAGVSLAIGEAARGIEGWRLTHREAQAARTVARCRPRRLTRYLDVALEAAALQDEALAQSLIDAFLSPLDDWRGGGGVPRRVLRALFRAEYNESSAAAELGVDRSTVHRWRNEIERRLGGRLHERQAEIEVALRVEELRAHHSAECSSSKRLD